MSPLVDDLYVCLRFWSRLPVPTAAMTGFEHAVRMLPIAGLVIATPAVVVLAIARDVFSLPAFVAAGLALTTLVATTGALHEDGLADTFDGLFGGSTPVRRLEIMRDSRIGTYGTLTLIGSVFLRAASLTALIGISTGLAACALFCAAAVSRTAGLLPLILLPPARSDGLGASATSLDPDAVKIAAVLAAVTLLLPIFGGASIVRTLVAGVVATAAAYALVPIAQKKIGGQTGDIAGASQQASEIAFLALLSGASGA